MIPYLCQTKVDWLVPVYDPLRRVNDHAGFGPNTPNMLGYLAAGEFVVVMNVIPTNLMSYGPFTHRAIVITRLGVGVVDFPEHVFSLKIEK